MNFSFTIFIFFLIGLFLELSPEQHFHVEWRSAQVVDIGEPNPCQPETPRNRQIMDWFLDLPTSHERRVETGTGHLTSSQVELLADTTAACVFLLSRWSENINAMLPDTAEKVYNITFYKAGSFYFATQSFHKSSNPNRLVFGLNSFSVYDSNLNFVDGYGF